MTGNRKGRKDGSYPLWVVLPLLALVLFMVVFARVYWGSYASYQEGMLHLENRAPVRAVTYFDRSLHWYTPFNPWVQASAERLWELGQEAQSKGDTRMALIAYRAIRQGFYAARSVYQPGKGWIQRAEAEIERITSRDRASAAEGSRELFAQREIRDPSVAWSLTVLLGLFGWVGSMACFILAQWGPWKGRRGWGAAPLLWCGGFVFFLILWIVGMIQA